MGTRVRARLRGVAVSVVVLLVAAAAPASSLPDDCPGQKSCQSVEADKAGKLQPRKPVPDTAAPTAPLLGTATVSPDGLVELSVTAEAKSRLVLEEDESRVLVRTRATGSLQLLSWTTTDGPHTYFVTATDKASNVTPAYVTVDVDATPPPVKRFITRSGTGTDSRSKIKVTTEPDTGFSLLVDGQLVKEGTTADGVIEQTLDIADGRHPVRVELRDDVGNLRTATRALVVAIPELEVDAELISEVTDSTQVVRVAAAAAAVGAIEVPGEQAQPFRLVNGAADVELSLSDGSYQDATVTVRDKRGRTGTALLPDFTVDMTAPEVAVETDQVAADEGKLSATLSTGESTVVAWQLLDADGTVVTDGEYVALGTDQTIARDVGEGSFELQVTATDTYGRATVERVSTRIAAAPLSTSAIVLIGVGLLLLLAAVGVGVLTWRRRRGDSEGARPRELKGRKALARLEALTVEQTAAFEEAEERWHKRRDVLTTLMDVAHGGVPVELPESVEVTLLPDETVLYTTGARLTEMLSGGRAAVAVEIDHGELLVTDQRLAFIGAQERRDWWHALVERLCHVDHRCTTIDLWDSEARSGIEYDDPEVARLYIDLAISERNGTRAAYLSGISHGLQNHEMRRPAPPEPFA